MNQDRPTKYLIKKGNYYRDIVANIVEILRREQRKDPDQRLTDQKRLTEVIEGDPFAVPQPPAIAVSWEEADEIPHTIGKRNVTYESTSRVTVWYYHEELNENTRKEDIRDNLWEIARLLRRNSDLNGLSPKGAHVEHVEIVNRPRLDKWYAGGKIIFVVPVLMQDRRGIS